MALIHTLHLGEHEVLAQLRQEIVGQNGENLIGYTGDQIRHTHFIEDTTNLVSHTNSMTGNVKVEVILKERLELNTQQAALGQHTALAFDHVTEVLSQDGIGIYNCLAEEGANLGTADVEHVTKPCQVIQAHIIALGNQTIAQAGTVHRPLSRQAEDSSSSSFRLYRVPSSVGLEI